MHEAQRVHEVQSTSLRRVGVAELGNALQQGLDERQQA
jgi:hypothetical protein